MLSAREALQRLQAGNERFVAHRSEHDTLTSVERRLTLTAAQEPFAVILGCSDSRVPAEIVFDQGLGDLFVIRVAGNIVASSQIGSVEFAVEVFGTPLVVVLGHTGCGAVNATVDQLEQPECEQSPNLRSIVDRIRPVVEPLLASGPRYDRFELVRRAVRANIRASVDQLRVGSAILQRHVDHHGLRVIGAEYSLESGRIDFFEGV